MTQRQVAKQAEQVGQVRPLRTNVPPDAELVARCLRGDGWAEEALYRRHVHKVERVAARLVRNSHDIEDVVQDAFVQAYSRLDTLQDPSRLASWLVSIVLNRARKKLRRRKLTRLLGLERSLDDEGLALQAAARASQEDRAELAAVDRVLETLHLEDRICWTLRHIEGHSLQETADLAGCSLATAKRRVKRASEALDALRGETP
ncbi:MAG: RNA polymerase sigma factor [Polyangiales bacterium]